MILQSVMEKSLQN